MTPRRLALAVGLVWLASATVALAAPTDGAVFDGPSGAVIGALSTAVVALFAELVRARHRDQKRIDSLEKQLEEAITARLAVAEKNTEFALSLQKEHHTIVDKQMVIMQALKPQGRE